MGCGHPHFLKIPAFRLAPNKYFKGAEILSELDLYNTLASQRQSFTPIKGGQVGMYVCGITPYDEAHVGHARCYVVFDILKRVLQHLGYKVRHIQNYTDVDDKIIERAKKLNISPAELAEKNIARFEHSMKLLHILPADDYPRVTQKIPNIIALIEKLVSRGLAYESGGSVWFSVRSFPQYGSLSKRKVDELEEGARVEIDPHKKDPLDFALWKSAKPGEPFWNSPWGAGRPGWHIECSVMSMEALGTEFDIHGGGQDLIFPHHENEQAQSIGATGGRFARFWVHNGFVTINKEKMSKSLGNFFTLSEVLDKVDPMVLRYFLISQHYKSPLNFSDQDLKSIETVWNHRIVGSYRIAQEREKSSNGKAELKSSLRKKAAQLVKNFNGALVQDLNTPEALGALNQFCSLIFESDKKSQNQLSPKSWTFLRENMDSMLNQLGLVINPEESWDPEVLQLVEKRQEARKNKNWAQSDQIRDELKKKGLSVEDTATGPRVKRI